MDYNVIPIIIADGCLYKCEFCRVKSKTDYKKRSPDNIHTQIINLKEFYGHNLNNYNSIFLAQNDALNAGIDLIEFAAKHSRDILKLNQSNLSGLNLFLFGSVASLNYADLNVFDRLENLPFKTYINIGLESADKKPLDGIKKSITAEAVDKAFARMLEINRGYDKIEITANFVFGEDLPPSHLTSFVDLAEKRLGCPYSKGAVYFSPLVNGGNEKNRGLVRKFYRVKNSSLLPTFIYLIQRL